MFVQDDLETPKIVSPDFSHHSHFSAIFIGAVVAPFALLAISGHSLNAPAQPSLAWLFLAIALLLTITTGIDLSIFKRKGIDLSIGLPVRRALAAPIKSL
jgi:hypothetical protein